MTNDELEAEIERCNPQIQAMADRWIAEYRQLSREDVVQEIKLAFVVASKKFDPSLATAAFATFALEHANWQVLGYARNELGRGIKHPKWMPLTTVDMLDLHKVVTADGTLLHETLATPSHEHEPLLDETIWEKLKLVLTDRQYEAVELSFRDDLEIAEIAERLQTSENAVSQALSRAQERIREFMSHLGKLLRARRAA